MKTVYSDFLGGISYYGRNAPANTYYEGIEVDPHRGAGYLQPGWAAAVVTKSDDVTQIITGLINDICPDPGTDDCYFIDNANLYHMTALAAETWNANFDGSSHYYYAVPNMTDGQQLVIFPTHIASAALANKLFFAYNTASVGDIGMYPLTGTTFDPDWMSTVPAGAGALQKAPHPIVIWNTYMWFGNGQYIGKFDGDTGANGTVTLDKLDLGKGWEITSLFTTRNYIGICAWKVHSQGAGFRTEAMAFFWDGVSATFNYSIPIADNKIVCSYNHNGTIYLVTYGRDLALTLSYLTETGTVKVRKLKFPISGSLTSLSGSSMNMADSFGNRLLLGSENLVISYGAEEMGQPNAVTIPWGYTRATQTAIGAIKTVFYNKVFFSYKDITNNKYYLLKAASGNSTSALYRGNYIDFGQKVRINYVKYYFQPLTSGDVVTPTLEFDYDVGTPIALADGSGNATISYAIDGAATSKRFNVSRTCHAVRPVIDWGVGGVAFGKIVIDYSYISD